MTTTNWMRVAAVGIAAALALAGCTAQLTGATSGVISDINTLNSVCPALIANQAQQISALKASLNKQ